MSDVWRELEERLKQKAWLHGRTAKGKEPICSMYPDNVGYAIWLEDVKEAVNQLKQRIREVFDQYMKAYPLDTPEDRQVSKVLNEIRKELLKE